MTQSAKVQLTRFLRDKIDSNKKFTSRDILDFVNKAKSFGMNNENISHIQCELNSYIESRIIYFQKRENEEKEKQYKKIKILNKKIFDYLEKQENPEV